MTKKHFIHCLAALCMGLILAFTDVLISAPLEAKADSCPFCFGSGKTFCSLCGGQGMKTCTLCGGSGGTFQSVPSFDPITGIMRFQQMRVSCSSCGGSGRSICTSCSGTGRRNCTNCGGTGRVWGSSSSGSSSGNSSSGSGSSGSNSDEGSSSHDHSDHKDNSNDIISGESVRGYVLDATPGVVPNENCTCLLDDDKTTKFNFIATSGYIIWKAPELIKVKSYALVTANDTSYYKGRNPRSWVLYGSNEELDRGSDKWNKIHVVEDDTILEPKNFTEFTFELDSETDAYQYFRLEILDNKGDPCTQLSELILRGTTVSAKSTTIKSVKADGKTLTVKWKKKSGVTGYEIEIADNKNFSSSTTKNVKGASKTSLKTDLDKASGKTYYVRIRTYKEVDGTKFYSKWSKKKEIK